MSKKMIATLILTGIILSACGGQAQATETPTAVPATTEPPALPATEAPTSTQEEVPVTGETPTPSPTATEFVPDNPTDCINKASFVTDVTIADKSDVTGGTAFVKTWRVRNAGTCIWWSGYTLTHYSGETFSAPASVPLPVTNPGETADISIDLIAPTTTGPLIGYFVIKNPADLIMQVDEDSRLWVDINVISGPTATPTVAAGAGGGAGSAAATTPAATASTPAGTIAASSSDATTVSAACAVTTDSARTSAMLTALTAYRATVNLAALPVNAQLSQAAQIHANDIACNNLFGHTGSDGSSPQSRVALTGYVASDVSENVYGSYPPLTGDGVISWWANDKTEIRHNENLLTTKFTEIGVGYAFFNNFGYYVIVFAKP